MFNILRNLITKQASEPPARIEPSIEIPSCKGIDPGRSWVSVHLKSWDDLSEGQRQKFFGAYPPEYSKRVDALFPIELRVLPSGELVELGGRDQRYRRNQTEGPFDGIRIGPHVLLSLREVAIWIVSNKWALSCLELRGTDDDFEKKTSLSALFVVADNSVFVRLGEIDRYYNQRLHHHMNSKDSGHCDNLLINQELSCASVAKARVRPRLINEHWSPAALSLSPAPAASSAIN